jgi:hypothetical protein
MLVALISDVGCLARMRSVGGAAQLWGLVDAGIRAEVVSPDAEVDTIEVDALISYKQWRSRLYGWSCRVHSQTLVLLSVQFTETRYRMRAC